MENKDSIAEVKPRKKRRSIRRTVIILCAVLVLIAVVLPMAVSAIVYETVFGERYTTDAFYAFSLSDFPGLQAERYTFLSDSGQTLVGYRYYREDQSPKAVVVMAHGLGGGGHRSDLDAANFFASNGLTVFAYDATGNDESEGSGVKGIPQGVIDLDHAISFVGQHADFAGLPVVLYGHSWGAYSVCAVLNCHPEVKAVVSLSGFSRPSDLIEVQGKTLVGGAIKLLMPYVKLWEKVKFGKYAGYTGMDGFAASNALVMVVHSTDDTTVPIEYGYDIYHEAYADSPRFQFVRFDDRNHNHIARSDRYLAYLNDVNAQYADARKQYGAASMTTEEQAQFRADWLSENYDRNEYINGINTELYQQMLALFDAALQ